MAAKHVKEEIVETNIVLEKAKGFWAKFSKPIIYIGSALIVGIVGWYAYQNFYKKPNNLKAEESMFAAEKIFGKMANSSAYTKDSLTLVLKGDKAQGVTGVLDIIKKYGSTPSGNRANFIAGSCYLQQKDFANAIKYLKEFDANGATQIESKANILLGHAYAEQKKTEDALNYYKKAATVVANDETMAPEALYIAAMYADAIGKNKEAVELFKQLKDKYPNNGHVSGGDVEKYLAKLGILE